LEVQLTDKNVIEMPTYLW